VEKLKNIGVVLWANKERMVLAVMVLVFGWRVYVVLTPEQSLPSTNYRLPKADDGEIPKAAVPPPPPLRQSVPLEASYTPNPFWALSSQQEIREREGAADADIALLRIQKGRGGRVRAQIRTAGSTQWFDEGASFESFQLLQINAEEGTCLVRSERLGRNITLRVGGS